MTDLESLCHRDGETGNGDHRHYQPQGDIADRLFEIGLRYELQENVMRHRFSMSLSHMPVNSGTFEMLG
jgi:hypothetical protein